MGIKNDFDVLIDNSHAFNGCPDLIIARDIYFNDKRTCSVLTPFMYAYLEEIIRSTTTEYGRDLVCNTYRKVGMSLIKLAKEQNIENKQYVKELNRIKKYFQQSTATDEGNNRNSTVHGYMHPRFWTEESFELLMHDIARMSKYAKF